jgi:hypothetical protein
MSKIRHDLADLVRSKNLSDHEAVLAYLALLIEELGLAEAYRHRRSIAYPGWYDLSDGCNPEIRIELNHIDREILSEFYWGYRCFNEPSGILPFMPQEEGQPYIKTMIVFLPSVRTPRLYARPLPTVDLYSINGD